MHQVLVYPAAGIEVLFNGTQLNSFAETSSEKVPSSNFESDTKYFPGTTIKPLSGSIHGTESSNGSKKLV